MGAADLPNDEHVRMFRPSDLGNIKRNHQYRILRKGEALPATVPLQAAFSSADVGIGNSKSFGDTFGLNNVGGNITECYICKVQNKKNSKYCKSCRAPLQLVCTQCAQPFEEDAKYCTQCGIPKEHVEQELADSQAMQSLTT